MFGLFDWMKVTAGVVVGFSLAYPIGHWRGEQQGRAVMQADLRQNALEEIQKRSKDNEEISRMDLAGLCAELGGRWVPDEQRCD